MRDDPKLSQKIDGYVRSLVRQGLAFCYQVEDKPYLQILKWEQRVRSKGKYPSADCGQMTDICQTNDGLGKGKGLGKGASNTISFDAENNCFQNIDSEQKSLWQKAYPATNIEIELAKAVAWLKANPTKTKSNYNKFLTSWLSRSQDSGGTKGVAVLVNQPEYKNSDNGWHRYIQSTKSWISVREDQVPQQFKETA